MREILFRENSRFPNRLKGVKQLTKEDIISALKSWADDCEDFVLETDFSTPFRADARMIREAVQIIESSAETEAKAAAIMTHYGAEKQLVILAEECGELIQECCKCLRLGIPFSEDMVYEMADVIVMIKEFKAVFPEYYLDKLEETIRFKLQRQIEKIENELGHGNKA